MANDKDFVVKNGIAITGSIRVNGSSSGTAIISAPSAAGTPTLTLPTTTGTIALLQNKLSAFAATTSSELAGVISDETGSGLLVFATSPTLTTPVLGVASATSINKVTLTAPATGSTLTIADGKTLTASNTLTFTGTDSSSVAFGAGGTVAYTGSTLAQFAATTSLQLAGVISDETGSGALVFGTAPTFTTTIDSGATFGAFASATALTLGYTSTAASTTNISTGAVASATTKTINLGTGGAAGSTTNITLGSSVGGTTAIASPTVTVAGVADTATAATHYYVETATDGAIRPKTLANATAELVTTTSVNSAAATTVGTVTSGTWSASFGAVSGANLTNLTAGNLTGTIPSSVLGNSSLFIGTTSIALNRTTASQTLTGVSIDGNAGTVTNGALTTGTLAQFAATTSSQLAGVISDETGSGSLVFAISPTFTTPTLGVASATTINKVTLTAPATGSTLTIADGKTLTASNTLTFTGTDSSSVAFGTGGTVAYTANKLSVFAATSSAELAGVISDETGSGVLVFATSPTFTTSIDSGATFGAFASSTALTIGYTGTAASTTNISTGAVATATTKTINIGTGAAAGSTTNINIGSAIGGTTTVNNSLTVTGNLIVNGTTTTFNSTTVTIDDPIFTLGGDTAPGSDDNKDRGIEFRYYSGSAKLGFFGFDDSTGYFTFIPDATNTSDVFSGTKGTLDVTSITGSAATWTTARTITLAGDLSGSVSIDGSTNVTLTATVAADTVALGTDTTGNYVLSITNGSYITGGNGGSEGAALTLAVDATTTNTASKVVARDSSGDFAAGIITATAVKIDTTYNLDSATATVASLTQTAIASFSATTYGGGKVTIQAYDSVTGARTMCELLIVHNGTTASATEYGIVNTGASSIATYDVDISGGNVRILATGATTNSTQYKVVQTLILA